MTGAMGEGRVRPLTGDDRAAGRGPVLYWMQRDQRAQDNWALLHAQAVALAGGRPLAVVFCLVPEFLDAARRQYAFMLAGLRETAADLAALNIPFVLLSGEPAREITDFARRHDVARLVLDLNPLRLPTAWQTEVTRLVTAPVEQVDAHNVVPVWVASPKQEYAAATLRPKLNRVLHRYLNEFPRLVKHPHGWAEAPAGLDLAAALDRVRAAEHGPPLAWITPGPEGGARGARRVRIAPARRLRPQPQRPDAAGAVRPLALLPFRSARAAARRAGRGDAPGNGGQPRGLPRGTDRPARTVRQLLPAHARLRHTAAFPTGRVAP